MIAGHHTGLGDYDTSETGRAALKERLKKRIEPFNDAPAEITEVRVELSPPTITDTALWVRMLFSSLVDADYLDTEAFFDARQSNLRGKYPSVGALTETFDVFMKGFLQNAPDTPLNRIRRSIYERSIEQAKQPPGIYTQYVPTGGGKTLSSMGFALHHAKNHGKRRIIYVIPYTSIIEQNAEVYRKIFGDAVIEHHSQFSIDDDDENYRAQKLATENWDAPIIVTTTVQFFESLFANRPSRCRKLHNIAQSVVVIDEVQTLPPEFLDPILKKIEALRRDYGVTFLLSTATQPDFQGFNLPEYSFAGLNIDGELMEDPDLLAKVLKRTEIVWTHESKRSIEEMVGLLSEIESSLLCVVNTRDRAKELYEALAKRSMGDERIYHLSANMCGTHRLALIEEIKSELQRGIRIKVVSTNLIEAGVDLDFPKVFRELAGLESIAQSAGRCNREGLLDRPGIVEVFAFDKEIPLYLRPAINALLEVYPDYCDDPMAPAAFQAYFKALYRQYSQNLDQKGILEKEEKRVLQWPFAAIAKAFKMIDDGYTQSVIVPFDDESRKNIELLSIQEELHRSLLRRLQRYAINLPKRSVAKLLGTGDIEEVIDGVFVLRNETLYREDIGFDERRAGLLDISSIVI